jgi:ligand-binding sensor domain-containing protein
VIRTVIVDNNENLWIGTDKGLAVFDRIRWTIYSKHNSILSNDAITTIVSDKHSENIWIGTEKGLVRYDGEQWTRFDDNTSALINDHIYSIAVDKRGIVWAGTFDHFQFAGRLNRFDGRKWETIKLEHKDLNSCFPQALVMDDNNILWMGVKGTTGGALVRINENDWQFIIDDVKKTSIAGIQAMVIHNNEKWIGTGAGLTTYSGAGFRNINSSNSSLPDNFVYTIALDQNGNKWIGTVAGGLAVYKQGGIVVSDTVLQVRDQSFTVYPNPVKSTATISYSITEKERVSICIFNSGGRAVEILQDRMVEKGSHILIWNAGKFPPGIYFCSITTGKKRHTKKVAKY